jgi:acyl-CoA synthetase (AMP-forming)/AMP-acid ligase II
VPYLLAREADLPDKIALQVLRLSGSERWSYGRLAREVRGITYGLAALDLPRGTCVLLRVGNSVEFPLAFLSCVGAGLLPVACPAGLTEAEVTLLAAETDSVLIIAAPGLSLPALPVASCRPTPCARWPMARRPMPGGATPDVRLTWSTRQAPPAARVRSSMPTAPSGRAGRCGTAGLVLARATGCCMRVQ